MENPKVNPLKSSRVVAALVLWLGTSSCWAQDALTSEQAKSAESERHAQDKHFTLKVLPLIKEKCLGCHGADTNDIKGEFDVRSLKSILAGGESEEPAIVPGKPEESPFYLAVTWEELEMPPKENDRLTEEQCEIIRQWIQAGSPWPDAAAQDRITKEEWSVEENEDGQIVATSGGLADEWTYRRYDPDEIWAFRPLRTEFAHGSIDEFVEEKLRQANLKSAAIATPSELVRRAYFDLTGLPPSPKQSSDFLKAYQKDGVEAWSALIDQLLESPRYGERWAQHWLDVVRYADTAGFSNDYERSNAWRYRDYVIRALNDDKPYDEFVMEQLAGDELRPEDPEAIVATGFLRMGPWGTAMIPQEEARQLYLDDVVHSVGQSFLSMPLRCCKCHDHKFDPIPTQDYYRVYATFATTQPAEVEAAFLPNENQDGFDEGRAFVERMHRFADDKRLALVNKREAAAKAWYEEHGLPYKDNNARKNDPEDMKPKRHVGLTEEEKGRLKVREQDEWIWNRRKERYQPMAQGVYNGPDTRMNSRRLRPPAGKYDTDWTPNSTIYNGGDLNAKGDPVTPGVLSACGLAVEGAPSHDPFALPTSQSGRRLAFAKWVASKDNPLTVRSYVNRIWQYHFGKGIVKTANNFGVKGDAPSHVELLDWLTQQFLQGGWKTKRIHKLIMMSAVYRRSTKHHDLEKLDAVDPNNLLLARFEPRRLTAEEFRDSTLAASGELNFQMGGVPILPEINMEVALQPRMIQFSIAPAHQPSRTPGQRNRRSIYAYRVRGQADPFLEVLNQPNPNDSCDFRDTAAVSPQAFTLFNSDVTMDRAIGLALKIQQAKNGGQQINMAFKRALGRAATKQEKSRLRKYVDEMEKYHETVQPEEVTYPTSVVRSLVEEFTGEPFEYDEWLPVFEDYVPDPKPATVDARTRALADMCLLLFNSNEFMYVY